MSNPVAGWYPDAEVPGGERWWDGAQWSDQRRTGTPAAFPTPPSASGYSAAPAAAPPPAASGYTAASVDAAASTPGYTTAPAPAPGYTAPGYTAGVQPAVPAQQNALAVVGLCIAGVALFIPFWGAAPIAGLVLSILGYRKSTELGGRGRGVAVAGIIVGGLAVVFTLGTFLITGRLR
jgi:hypothetical protein